MLQYLTFYSGRSSQSLSSLISVRLGSQSPLGSLLDMALEGFQASQPYYR